MTWQDTIKHHQFLEKKFIFEKDLLIQTKSQNNFFQIYISAINEKIGFICSRKLCTFCAVSTKSVRLDLLRNELESSQNMHRTKYKIAYLLWYLTPCHPLAHLTSS